MFVNYLLTILETIALVASTTGVTAPPWRPCNNYTEQILSSNPLGECECANHFFMKGPECKQGFWCFDTSGAGCYLTCAPDEQLVQFVNNGTWSCWKDVDGRVCPPEGYDQYPPYVPDPDPIDPAANPIGNCQCEGEVWISEGCTYGWECYSDVPLNSGSLINFCAEDEVLLVNYETLDLYCSLKVEDCPRIVHNFGCNATSLTTTTTTTTTTSTGTKTSSTTTTSTTTTSTTTTTSSKATKTSTITTSSMIIVGYLSKFIS